MKNSVILPALCTADQLKDECGGRGWGEGDGIPSQVVRRLEKGGTGNLLEVIPYRLCAK
jgi:hypothetical protein